MPHFFKLLLTGIVMLTSSAAFATACGGLDNTWDQTERKIEDYVGEVWNAMVLTEGNMYDRGYEMSQDLKVVRGKHALRLVGEKGAYVFRFGSSLQHRRTDISFLTRPTSQLSDEASIYHELLIRGTFESPASASEGRNKKGEKATLVIQGLGNACLDGGAFMKWLLVLEDPNLVVWGTVMPAKAKTNQGMKSGLSKGVGG